MKNMKESIKHLIKEANPLLLLRRRKSRKRLQNKEFNVEKRWPVEGRRISVYSSPKKKDEAKRLEKRQAFLCNSGKVCRRNRRPESSVSYLQMQAGY